MGKQMMRTTAAAAALGIMAAPSFAQELTYGSVALDYTTIQPEDSSVSDISNFALQGDAEFMVDQILLGVALGSDRFEIGGNDLTVTTLDAFAGYSITPEALVGAGVLYTRFDDDFGDEDFTGFEVFGQYETAGFGVGVSYARPDQDIEDLDLTTLFAEGEVAPGFVLGGVFQQFSDIDETSYFLSAEYDDGPIFARGYYAGITDIDFDLFGVRGAYGLGNGISVTGGVESSSGDDLGEEYTAISIGGEYEFSPGVSASARYTKFDIDGGEGADAFGIGLNYEMGSQKRIDRRMADDVRDDLETGIFGVVPNFGFGILFGGFGI